MKSLTSFQHHQPRFIIVHHGEPTHSQWIHRYYLLRISHLITIAHQLSHTHKPWNRPSSWLHHQLAITHQVHTSINRQVNHSTIKLTINHQPPTHLNNRLPHGTTLPRHRGSRRWATPPAPGRPDPAVRPGSAPSAPNPSARALAETNSPCWDLTRWKVMVNLPWSVIIQPWWLTWTIYELGDTPWDNQPWCLGLPSLIWGWSVL